MLEVLYMLNYKTISPVCLVTKSMLSVSYTIPHASKNAKLRHASMMLNVETNDIQLILLERSV